MSRLPSYARSYLLTLTLTDAARQYRQYAERLVLDGASPTRFSNTCSWPSSMTASNNQTVRHPLLEMSQDVRLLKPALKSPKTSHQPPCHLPEFYNRLMDKFMPAERVADYLQTRLPEGAIRSTLASLAFALVFRTLVRGWNLLLVHCDGSARCHGFRTVGCH
jgi:hypothetical protein